MLTFTVMFEQVSGRMANDFGYKLSELDAVTLDDPLGKMNVEFLLLAS